MKLKDHIFQNHFDFKKGYGTRKLFLPIQLVNEIWNFKNAQIWLKQKVNKK